MGCGCSAHKSPKTTDGIQEAHGDWQRCQVLCQTVGDPSKADPRFDKLTATLAKLFDVPICMVTLLDGDWTHTASGHGVSPTDPKLRRQHSFCAWSLLPLNPEVLVVPDATLDKRFCDLPRVRGPPHLMFYAGAPLVDRSGVRFGSLCLIDFKARHDFTAAAASMLCNFASIVAQQLQSGRNDDDCGACLIDVADGWTTMWCTSAWEESVNPNDVGHNFWDRYKWWGATRSPDAMYSEAVRTGKTFTSLVSHMTSENAASAFLLKFRPAAASSVLTDAPRITIDIPAPASPEAADDWHRRYYIAVITKTDSCCEGSLETVVMPNLSVGHLLGRGSFGAVHMGVYRNAPVAVKTMQTATAEEVAIEIVVGEASDHINLVQTYTHATAPVSNMYETVLVMELCTGSSLRNAIDEGVFHRAKTDVVFGSPDMPKIMAAALDICSGLAYLHNLNFVHTDLSTNNVLLAHENCKICDFGMAHRAKGKQHSTQMGTITYMPPELIRDGTLSAAVDVYSVGVIMWELYSGARPWAGRRAAGVMAEKLQSTCVLQFPSNAPKMYKDLATTCMSPDPEKRLQVDVLLKELLHTKTVMAW